MHNLNSAQLKHHAAIGGVALHWTHVENFVQSILWRLAGLKPDIGRCITHHMPFRSLCDAILTIANEMPAYKHFAPELGLLFRECDQLRVKRNDTVHALWAIFLQSGNDEEESIELRAGEVEGMIIKARGRLNIKINSTTATQIDNISEDIVSFSKKLAEFVSKNMPA